MCEACLLLPLAVAASKPGTYQMGGENARNM